jgi:hypothetical protein
MSRQHGNSGEDIGYIDKERLENNDIEPKVPGSIKHYAGADY